jgi:ATF/CREB family transcription factor
MYGTENDNLNATVQSLREEIVSLKTLLLAHKDCPVARANGIQMDGPTLSDTYGHIPMMQTGYPAMMSQGVMHQQQPGERRFS